MFVHTHLVLSFLIDFIHILTITLQALNSVFYLVDDDGISASQKISVTSAIERIKNQIGTFQIENRTKINRIEPNLF